MNSAPRKSKKIFPKCYVCPTLWELRASVFHQRGPFQCPNPPAGLFSHWQLLRSLLSPQLQLLSPLNTEVLTCLLSFSPHSQVLWERGTLFYFLLFTQNPEQHLPCTLSKHWYREEGTWARSGCTTKPRVAPCWKRGPDIGREPQSLDSPRRAPVRYGFN